MPESYTELLEQARRARTEKRPLDARRYLNGAVESCRGGGVPLDLARALAALGQIERDLNHIDAAIEHYEEAAAIYRSNACTLRLAHTIRHLGDIHRHESRGDLARSCYREALDLYRAEKDTQPLELANALRGYALLEELSGDAVAAKSRWEEAKNLYAAVGVEAGVNESSIRIARLAVAQ